MTPESEQEFQTIKVVFEIPAQLDYLNEPRYLDDIIAEADPKSINGGQVGSIANETDNVTLANKPGLLANMAFPNI